MSGYLFFVIETSLCDSYSSIFRYDENPPILIKFELFLYAREAQVIHVMLSYISIKGSFGKF